MDEILALNAAGKLTWNLTDQAVVFNRGDGFTYIGIPYPPADFDSDGDGDGADFLTWQAGFGQFPGGGAAYADGDADRDGDVDRDDFYVWQYHFGFKGRTIISVSVPEQNAALLTLLTSVGLWAAATWPSLSRRKRLKLAGFLPVNPGNPNLPPGTLQLD